MAEIRLDGLLRAILDTAEKNRRRNSPEAKAKRSARSVKAAATRKARLEELRRAEEWIEARIPDGPVCGAFGIIHQAQETSCIRTPHRHGDHEDAGGAFWPSFEGEYDEMLTLTADHLRDLLKSPAEKPVLYVARDEDTGEPVRLEVGPRTHAPFSSVVVRHHELVDALGGLSHPDGVAQDALERLVEGYQAEVDAMEERASETPDDACLDADGNEYPEHDYPPVGEGNKCRRCGAETEE